MEEKRRRSQVLAYKNESSFVVRPKVADRRQRAGSLVKSLPLLFETNHGRHRKRRLYTVNFGRTIVSDSLSHKLSAKSNETKVTMSIGKELASRFTFLTLTAIVLVEHQDANESM